MICRVQGCGRVVEALGLCDKHYRAQLRRRPRAEPVPVCSVAGCGRPAAHLGKCWGHYKRDRRGRPSDLPVRDRADVTRRRHRNQLLTSGAEQCRRVAAQCLPDREVYVLLTSQGALPEWGLPGAVAAFGRCLDVEAMGWFKQRGQWRGRGSALWIDDLTIVDAIKGNLFDPSAERWYFETLLGAVVHESAHAIISGVGEEPADAALLEHAAIVREASVMVETSRDQGVPWAGHGVPFLRAAFHLRFRDLAGRYLPIARVADTAMYGLGLAHPFWTALVPEMESAAEKQTPIAEVLREPPPAAFADRWRGGVAAWAERQEQLTKRQLRHVVAALRLFSSEVT